MGNKKYLKFVKLKKSFKFTDSSNISFLTSGLTKSQKSLLRSTISRLQYKYKFKIKLYNTFCSKITHLLVNTTNGLCDRTNDYLKCVLKKKYIVTFEFYLHLLNERVDESLFLPDGDLSVGKTSTAGEVFYQKRELLFTNKRFLIKFEDEETQNVKNLIKLGGGSLSRGKDLIVVEHANVVYDMISLY